MSKGRQRTQKWYLKNEAEVMQDLGLKPAKGSGNGWVEKEDGENDYVIAQLKSTDKESYKINQLDLEKLEYHAMVSSKTPMFVIQFLNNDSRYALVSIEDIPKIAEYINTGRIEKTQSEPIIELSELPKKDINKIKSSKSSRDKFFKDKEKAWENRKWK
jgi:Holliday junction resolvase